MIRDMTSTIRDIFGERLRENVPLAPYTSARVGGPADYLLEVGSAAQLAEAVQQLWRAGIRFTLLGGGSNVLVSDKGVRGLVLLNRAKDVRFERGDPTFVYCESGAVFSNLAHRAAALGLSGLEWAATVPGTVGGAVYGNAGAFGGDMAGSLIRAEILTPDGLAWRSAEELDYGYRSSALKRGSRNAVVLSAEILLHTSDPAEVQARIKDFTAQRKASQPPGASMGSMFKNPTGDFAGRLLETAGLKGARVGSAQISPLHGNFFINTGDTRADDIKSLIDLAQQTVLEKFGVQLELEVELLGVW
jgi:UDP-N-acetylmuramate dehydrogenase